MNAADEIREMFPGHNFGAPCTETEIEQAEAALGESLPSNLHELYFQFNGFLGSTDARFFWPLFGYEGLVELNQFFRGPEGFPPEIVAKTLFFGDSGTGSQWGIKSDIPNKVIRWNAGWGSDFEIDGDSPLDVWRAAKQLYDDIIESM
jgi:hypothetical protein